MIRKNLVLVVLVVLVGGLAGGCGPSAEPAPATNAPGKPVAGVCKHNVMDADCPFCHPDLIEKLGFCTEHGVSEAECWICKPSMVAAWKAKGDWCGEHGVPESKCKLCGK